MDRRRWRGAQCDLGPDGPVAVGGGTGCLDAQTEDAVFRAGVPPEGGRRMRVGPADQISLLARDRGPWAMVLAPGRWQPLDGVFPTGTAGPDLSIHTEHADGGGR